MVLLYNSLLINNNYIMKKLFLSLLSALLILGLMQTALALYSPSYSDIGEEHPYWTSIRALSNEEIIIGYEDGSFRPDKPVSRAEFMKMAMLYLESDYEDGHIDCFEDTKGHWAEEIICAAKIGEFVHGDSTDGLFHPERSVNFVEAAKILNYMYYYPAKTPSDPWYLDAVRDLEIQKAIPPTVLAPDHQMTRSEVAEILHRMKVKVRSTDLFNVQILDPEGPSTWEYISPYFNRRDGEMYSGNFDKLPLEYFNEAFASDGKVLYFFSDLGFAGVVIPPLDPNTLTVPEDTRIYLEIIDNDYDYPLPMIYVDHIMDEENSYLFLSSDLFDGKGNQWRAALDNPDADLASSRLSDVLVLLTVPNAEHDEVEFVGKNHFKVGEKVYYMNTEMEGVDVESFGVYMEEDGMKWLQRFSYDSENVYTKGELIEGSDPETFSEAAGTSWYYKDKNYVYSSEGERLGNLETFSFYVDNTNYYATSDTGVYLYGKLVEGADPETFVYTRDDCNYIDSGYDANGYFLEDPDTGYYSDLVEVTEEEWLEVCGED